MTVFQMKKNQTKNNKQTKTNKQTTTNTTTPSINIPKDNDAYTLKNKQSKMTL